jgi:hypothetical protein
LIFVYNRKIIQASTNLHTKKQEGNATASLAKASYQGKLIRNHLRLACGGAMKPGSSGMAQYFLRLTNMEHKESDWTDCCGGIDNVLLLLFGYQLVVHANIEHMGYEKQRIG